MNQSKTVLVEYIGEKEIKTDNVANSGTVWLGKGDVQPVTPEQWGRMSKHKDVWKLVAAPTLSELRSLMDSGAQDTDQNAPQPPAPTPVAQPVPSPVAAPAPAPAPAPVPAPAPAPKAPAAKTAANKPAPTPVAQAPKAD